ncbi:1-deoxy-D-xylulose-5-phosphate reductoisomerase [Roseibium denhamense]|nr:1-deoxy-D-xylulose-5-phosphate reductoisomerase [Roseibium denhamense]
MPDGQSRETGQKTRITVLGATGSIGLSVADIIERNPDQFDVVALVANQNADVLADLAVRLRADCAVLADDGNLPDLKARLSGQPVDVAAGSSAVLEAVDRDTDIVVGAIVGAAGLVPTLAAVKPGRRIALANKECLVCAGDLFMAAIRDQGAELLPVDSEHNAIFQVFETNQADQVEKVILTASGGPFRELPLEQMATVTPAQALKHPNWDMGARISIDSATLMNKGFEVIEAFHLFPVRRDQLDVLVHPQSAVHGLVQYKDGSLLAQLGHPDMRTPIAHCLSYPKRMPVPVERLDLAALGTLTFATPDTQRFPAFKLAMQALETGGGAPAVLNAADEVAVAAFLEGRIGYPGIPDVIGAVLERFDRDGRLKGSMDIDGVLALDADARKFASDWISSR